MSRLEIQQENPRCSIALQIVSATLWSLEAKLIKICAGIRDSRHSNLRKELFRVSRSRCKKLRSGLQHASAEAVRSGTLIATDLGRSPSQSTASAPPWATPPALQ